MPAKPWIERVARTLKDKSDEAYKRIKSEPQLLVQCHEARAAVNQAALEALRSLIDLGRRGQAILSDPARWGPENSAMRGFDAIDMIGQSLEQHRPTFREAMQIVATFTDEVLETFLTRRSLTGQFITLAHVRVIMRLTSEVQRGKLIDNFYARSSNPTQLRAQARKLLGPKRPAMPRAKSLNAVFEHLTHMAQVFKVRIDESLQQVLIRPLREWVDGKGTPGPDDLEKLVKLHEHLVGLFDSLVPAFEVIEAAKNAVRERLKANG